MAKISSSNTKAEILKAYHEQVKQLGTRQEENAALRKELEQKQVLLEQAKDIVKTDATSSIKQIRDGLNDQFGILEEALNEEQKKLGLLRQAVIALEQEIENLHQIKAQAESLEALTITYRGAKEKLEKQMSERKEELEENITKTKKNWEREEEEYQYHLKLKRRNEQDKYEAEKEALEKDMVERKIEFEKTISERERAVADQEDELKHLRKEMEAFDTRLQEAVAKAEERVTNQLKKEFEYRQKLESKDLEANLKLRDQMIQSLQNKIQEQSELLASMSNKTDTATQQVKDIALKAIEKSGIISIPSERRAERSDKQGN